MAPEIDQQFKPLAPTAYRIRSDEDEALYMQQKLRRRRCIKCCGCFTALFLILAVVLLVLAFTVFHIKDPVIRMNSVTLQHLNLTTSTATILADVSVKNPNAVAFRYGNSTTTVYYREERVGEGTIPHGKAKARRTQRMNMTMYIMLDKIFSAPSYSSDSSSGALPMSTFTKLSGRVKILKISKKNVVVQMNCTLTYNVMSQAIQDKKSCRSRVNL
ncbi:hypothetical protein I3843_11G125200 [Carya illinoinensis]|uniref:Late embryogenesis abundant protein LEA-2 subgroup domain-containing protein n=1 Tax=Carya illinoinensis TaxID=32201 RepID=A0A8T1P6Y1_CARIL|nr:uncharacterized protein LOC122282437 [Carya illinoinensis]KAG2681021.1 hypothetical protein I3760_11G125000 [Carya illinoinensis]KAG6636687.1 hypothetical protein CIPAW_11G128100 [Carya illinoinensis]KAG6688483.1 hypothetical protein I3842_11G126900 [Carya illinoinensis]KAG7956470.1 hypothetical protein I3843_11G125200 [Carya illinoinensis]